jgi:hypothetical protein
MRPRFLPLGLAWLALVSAAAAAEPKTAQEIVACLEANLPESSSVQTIALRAKDRVGAVTESKAKIYWRKFEDDKSRVLIEFFAPADLRGSSVLMLDRKVGERDMFLYLPELGRVKRITSRMMSGSMFGTDFSYEDFELIEDYAAKAKNERMEDAVVDGAPAWVLESRPAPGELSAYTRVVEYVDPEHCVRIKSELYEANDRLRKVASSDRKTLTQIKGLWYAPKILLRDVTEQTETELMIEAIEVGVDIPQKRFSEANLTKGH